MRVLPCRSTSTGEVIWGHTQPRDCYSEDEISVEAASDRNVFPGPRVHEDRSCPLRANDCVASVLIFCPDPEAQGEVSSSLCPAHCHVHARMCVCVCVSGPAFLSGQS